uniref:F-box protein At2g17036 n=1 Tax=Anthurium amnicola TaxID=1678845 RepID=A0A1D1XHR6_9ARAE
MEEEQKTRKATLSVRCSAASDGGGSVVGRSSAETTNRDWSGLPQSAVYLILKGLLPSPADVLSSGSVCKPWRSVFTVCKRDLFSSLPPLLFFIASSPSPPGSFHNFMEGRTYRRNRPVKPFARPGTKIVGVSHGYWIVIKCYSRSIERIVLVDPMARSPATVKLPLPKPGHPVAAFMTAPPTSPDCVVVTVLEHAIRYCRPGDAKWTCPKLTLDHMMLFHKYKVALLQGKVYALRTHTELRVFELSPQLSFSVVKVKGLTQRCYRSAVTLRLVESNGEILLITSEGGRRPPSCPSINAPYDCPLDHTYVVRKLDLPARRWVTLSTLGDRSIFIGMGGVLTCPAARCGGRGDRIYRVCVLSSTIVAFNVKDGRIEHHAVPEEYGFSAWTIPNSCCQ